jgi:ribokinase
VIVVIGSLRLRSTEDGFAPDGLAADIARIAAAEGSRVEFIGKVGDDPAGDELLLALARLHVGHVATLRDAAHATPVLEGSTVAIDPAAEDDDIDMPPDDGSDADRPILEAADVGLALRYLTDVGVIVAIHVGPAVLDEAIDAAAWASAPLIVVLEGEGDAPSSLPFGALVVAATSDDGDSAIGDAIGRYVAAIDRGDDPAAAYASILAGGAGVATG